MKALLATALLAFSTLTAAQGSPLSPTQAEALGALARVYGVVRYFHPSDSLDSVAWDRFLVHAAERMGSVSGRAEIGPRLEELFSPVVAGFQVAAAGASASVAKGEGPRIEWRHLGYGLETDRGSPYASWRTHHDALREGKVKGGYFQHRAAAEVSVHRDPVQRITVVPGLEAHVPVSLPLSAVKIGATQKEDLDRLASTLAPVPMAAEVATRAQAHADGIATWNVARHFYPYWSLVNVDWETQLRDWLAEQPPSQTRAQLRDALRRLTAPLDDGHVGIHDPADKATRRFLGISVRPVGKQWVVDASVVPEKAKAGDVVVAVDGKPAARWFDERLALHSGSPQHKRWRVRFDLLHGAEGATVALRLARGQRVLEAVLPYDKHFAMQGPRPAAIAEVIPGVYYLDVTRFDKAAFEQSLPKLAAARAIVFDLRGYPRGEANLLVPYWLKAEDKAQWMFVPRYDKPFAESTTGWSIGWQAVRKAELEKPRKALLVDGRSISYSESLAAYFPAHQVGPVVGDATAGANGNVARATLPSGMSFLFTGMRVTRHDGTTALHRVGVVPDHAVEPTVEGIRAGRDEVLESALRLLQARTSP